MKRNWEVIRKRIAMTALSGVIALGVSGADRATAQGGDEDDKNPTPTPLSQVVSPEDLGSPDNITVVGNPGETLLAGEETESNLYPELYKTASQTLILDVQSWENVPPENVPQVESFREDWLTAYQVNSEWRAVRQNTPGFQDLSFIDFLNRRAAGEVFKMTYIARNINTGEIVEVTQELGLLTFTGSHDDGSLKVQLDKENPRYETLLADNTYPEALPYHWGSIARTGTFFDPEDPTKVFMVATVTGKLLWHSPTIRYNQWWYDEAQLSNSVSTAMDTQSLPLKIQIEAYEGRLGSANSIPEAALTPGSFIEDAYYKYLVVFETEGEPPSVAVRFISTGPHPDK